MKRNRIILLTLLSLFSSQILKSQTKEYYGDGAGNLGYGNSSFGYYAGAVVTGNYNTFNGYQAGKATTSGNYNVFSGANSGLSNIGGDQNTYLGYRVCVLATSASYNTVVGYKAGTLMSTGEYNAFLGSNAGYMTSTGSGNVYLGFYSGFNSTGSRNIFIGYSSGYYETGSNKLYIENSNSDTPLIYGDFASDYVKINGKLGIGTSEFGDAELAVAGIIVAKDVIVTVDDFPDYVFEDNYNLLSLPELQSFIETHKHLPGIKSEAEVIEEGLPLGELNVQILEKIEELTLHVIDLDKKANTITQKGKELQIKIGMLQAN